VQLNFYGRTIGSSVSRVASEYGQIVPRVSQLVLFVVRYSTEKGTPVRCISSRYTPLLKSSRLGVAALAVVLVLNVSGIARAVMVSIPGLFNTGVNSLGNPLAAGAVDPHYTLISSDDPAFPGPNALVTDSPLPGGWTPNTPTAQWISPNAEQTPLDNGGPGTGNSVGTYIYDLPFNMTGLDPTQASITGSWAVDTIGLIYLNGAYVGLTTNLGGSSTPTPFSVPIGSNFGPGVNHLDFVVINAAAGSTGMIVQGIGGNAPGIPEPSTIVLAGLGFVSLIVVRLRRRKSL
jgi:hypothetical protein